VTAIKLAYSVAEAAAAAGVSAALIRQALNTSDPQAFPPPLVAKRLGDAKNARRLIFADDLKSWLASFPDA
jgi:hypothetical protein